MKNKEIEWKYYRTLSTHYHTLSTLTNLLVDSTVSCKCNVVFKRKDFIYCSIVVSRGKSLIRNRSKHCRLSLGY